MAECLLTPPVIHRELERLAGLPPDSTRLHSNMSTGDCWMLWQVGNRFIRVGPVPEADLRLSLDDFSARYCAPVVKRRQDGIND